MTAKSNIVVSAQGRLAVPFMGGKSAYSAVLTLSSGKTVEIKRVAGKLPPQAEAEAWIGRDVTFLV